MNKLPKRPLSSIHILITTLAAYPKVFKQIFWLAAVSSIGHLAIPSLLLKNTAFAAVAAVGFILLTWFLYTAIIARSKVALLGGKMGLREAFRLAKRRYLWVLGGNLVFFGIGAFTALAIFAIDMIFDLMHLHPVYLALATMISITVFIYLYFAIPEIALEGATSLRAFEKSIRLVHHHWWHTFIVLAFVGAAMLGCEALGVLFTGKDRMILFTGYHFAVQLMFYPLIVTTTVLLLNDLKLRVREGTLSH